MRNWARKRREKRQDEWMSRELPSWLSGLLIADTVLSVVCAELKRALRRQRHDEVNRDLRHGALSQLTAGTAVTALLLLTLLAPCSVAGSSASSLADAPLQVHSVEENDRLGANVSGRFDHSFVRVAEALTSPEAWCEFMPLVFNIKSCVWEVEDGETFLALYIGRKFFDPPKEFLRLKYAFQVLHQEGDRVNVLLFAAEGPQGTRDYLIEVLAQADSAERTELRLHSSFQPSLRSSLATELYLATSGRDKVGFSVLQSEAGKPNFVGGKRGIIERNAMRYYLALKAYLDTLDTAPENRFEARLNAWFDLTEKYPRQLHEMSRGEYLRGKKKEREYQMKLQEKKDRRAPLPQPAAGGSPGE